MSSEEIKKKAKKNKDKQPKKPKQQQTKLRLIKNGDLPVAEEISKPAKKSKDKSGGGKDKSSAGKDKSGVKKKDKISYRDKPDIKEWYIQNRSLILIGSTVFGVLAIIGAVCFYLLTAYKVTTVYVDGNIHYSNEEVMDMVMTGYLGNNSLYLALKYKNKGIEGVPFVEEMDVNVLSPDSIRINVYEKALAGYVEYLGRYIYFDKDGIAVEASEMRTKGIPQVTGLSFGYVVLHEPLPVEDEEIFKDILSIAQLLEKYNLAADKLYFDSDKNLTLYFEQVRVTLGGRDGLDEKMMRLQYILPELQGKKGTLSMENLSEDTKNITFHADEN